MPSGREPIRFGLFEVNLATGEIRRDGTKVRLQEQPFQVLAALLEKPGEIVTKEELQVRIWKDDTFVDFDRSLATAINKVRQALDDSATRPRYVETVPKKGYRFVGPTSAGADRATDPGRHQTALRLAAATATLALAAAAAWWFSQPSESPSRTPFSTPEPLTTYPGDERQPSISPDGSRVAFSWELEDSAQTDIYVKQIGPGEPSRLTDHPADEGWPQWSPDGQHIAFARSDDRFSGEVVRIPASGGQAVGLSSFQSPGTRLSRSRPFSWTPEGDGVVVVDREDNDAAPLLYLVSIESGERRALTRQTEGSEGHSGPSFSESGTLAYLQHNSDGSTDVLVWRLEDVEAPRGQPKVAGSLSYRVTGASISPAADEVLLSAWAPMPALWRIPLVQEGPAERVVGATGQAIQPSFSGDGGMVAYGTWNHSWDIWRLELIEPGVAAGPPERLIGSTYDDTWPDYSPDNRQVAFQSTRGGSHQIWLADSEGTEAISLTSRDSSMTGSPAWSPDGSKIAFDSMVGGKFSVFTMNANGSRVLQVTEPDVVAYRPRWSGDGNWIYFQIGGDGDPGLARVRATGGVAEILAEGFIGEVGDAGRYAYGRKMQAGETSRPVSRLDLEDGQVEEIIDGPVLDFQYAPEGIYFVSDGPLLLPSEILFYRFSDKEVVKVATPPLSAPARLNVSRDGRYLTFSQAQSLGGDLMLIRDYR